MTKRTKVFKTLIAVGGCIGLLAVFFFSCEKMPEYCGDGNPLNPETQFCYGGVTYGKCSGGEYDPATQMCENDILKTRCAGGEMFHNPETEFCDGGRAYVICNRMTYNPNDQICEGGIVKTRCGSEDNYFNPADEFCFGNGIYSKCNGEEYDPRTHVCGIGNTIHVICEGDRYVPIGTPCDGYILTTAAAPANGGTITRNPDAPNYAPGTLVGVTATPASGYTFTGWSGASTSTSLTATITMDSDKSLVAMFREADRPDIATLSTTVIPYNNAGSISLNPTNSPGLPAGDYILGTQVTATATAAQNYRFIGWGGAATSASSGVVVSMDGSRALIANFQLRTYMLTTNVSPSGGGSVERTPNLASYNAGTQINIAANPANGYRFVDWTVTIGTATITNPNSENTAVSLSSDAAVRANFVRIFTLTANAGTGGSVTGSGTFDEGVNAAITATPNTGYTFSGWTPTTGVGDPSAATTTVSMAANRTVTANFQLQTVTPTTYTLTVNRDPTAGGTITGGGTFNAGTDATITATPNTGYTFTEWTPTTGVANPNSATTTVSMTANRTVTATFQPITYTLTVNAGIGGIATDGGTFSYGAMPTITATPNTGYTFSGWTPTTGITIPGAATTTISMTENRTVTANFQPITYTLTVNAGTGGTAIGGGTFNYGTNAIITATPSTNYTFSGWTPTTGVTSPSAATTTISMIANRTVTANFQSTAYTLTINRDPSVGGTIIGGGIFNVGDNATITATPNIGYTFSGWTPTMGIVDPSAANTTVSMTADRTVTANFRQTSTILGKHFTDSRDGKSYSTVVIGTQTWMAENLNYEAGGSICNGNNPSNCEIYGRLYEWNTIMDGAASSSASPSGVRGICPAGWHIPSDAEWTTLTDFVSVNGTGNGNVGAKLKAGEWWIGDGNGTDEFGFSALPGGVCCIGNATITGHNGSWWSVTESGSNLAWERYMDWGGSFVGRVATPKTYMFSLRCVAD